MYRWHFVGTFLEIWWIGRGWQCPKFSQLEQNHAKWVFKIYTINIIFIKNQQGINK